MVKMAFFCAGSSGEAKKKNSKPGMDSELCVCFCVILIIIMSFVCVCVCVCVCACVLFVLDL